MGRTKIWIKRRAATIAARRNRVENAPMAVKSFKIVSEERLATETTDWVLSVDLNNIEVSHKVEDNSDPEDDNAEASTSTAARQGKKRGRDISLSRNNNQMSSLSGSSDGLRYTIDSLFEEKRHQSIFGVAFNEVPVQWARGLDKPTQDWFATCGDKVCTVYSYDQSTDKFVPHSIYRDDEDVFYTCCFTWNPTTAHYVVIFAGKRGLIRVVDIHTQQLQTLRTYELSGHVNDLKVPLWARIGKGNWWPNLLLSAHKDNSIRLWNTQNAMLIAVFGGPLGHQGEVLSVDIHPTEHYFVSCGVDRTIRVWSFQNWKLLDDICETNLIEFNDPRKEISMYGIEERPVFITRAIHELMLDSVAWFKDGFITRSFMEDISVFQPGKAPVSDQQVHFDTAVVPSDEDDWFEQDAIGQVGGKRRKVGPIPSTDVDVSENLENRFQLPPLHEIARVHVDDTKCWFMLFGKDYRRQFVGMGDMQGNVLLWDLRKDSFTQKPIQMPAHPATQGSVVRQVAFNFDSNKMVAVTDKCKVVVFDLAGVDKVYKKEIVKPSGLTPDMPQFWLNKFNENVNRPFSALIVTQEQLPTTKSPETATIVRQSISETISVGSIDLASKPPGKKSTDQEAGTSSNANSGDIESKSTPLDTSSGPGIVPQAVNRELAADFPVSASNSVNEPGGLGRGENPIDPNSDIDPIPMMTAAVDNVPEQSLSLDSSNNPIVVQSPKKSSNVVPEDLGESCMMTSAIPTSGTPIESGPTLAIRDSSSTLHQPAQRGQES